MTKIQSIINILEKYQGDLELISYGLAPNPNGFCYEVINPENIPHWQLREFNSLLDQLTTDEENQLKALYL